VTAAVGSSTKGGVTTWTKERSNQGEVVGVHPIMIYLHSCEPKRAIDRLYRGDTGVRGRDIAARVPSLERCLSAE
jgi:hypothetical protein